MMTTYQHILLAVDFLEHDHRVIERSQQLVASYQAKLSIAHVIDSLAIADGGFGGEIPLNFDLYSELQEAAKQRIYQLANDLGVAAEQVFLEMGNPRDEIVRVATENQVDLIIVGSHSRHGLVLLMGSTADGIMHHAPCDVLAVHLH
ncbi:universal stress protein [Methylosoma difficile]